MVLCGRRITSLPIWLKALDSAPTLGTLTVPLTGVLSYATLLVVVAPARLGATMVAPTRPARARGRYFFKVSS